MALVFVRDLWGLFRDAYLFRFEFNRVGLRWHVEWKEMLFSAGAVGKERIVIDMIVRCSVEEFGGGVCFTSFSFDEALIRLRGTIRAITLAIRAND